MTTSRVSTPPIFPAAALPPSALASIWKEVGVIVWIDMLLELDTRIIRTDCHSLNLDDRQLSLALVDDGMSQFALLPLKVDLMATTNFETFERAVFPSIRQGR